MRWTPTISSATNNSREISGAGKAVRRGLEVLAELSIAQDVAFIERSKSATRKNRKDKKGDHRPWFKKRMSFGRSTPKSVYAELGFTVGNHNGPGGVWNSMVLEHYAYNRIEIVLSS
jgi:hypothetical protein